MTTTGDDQEPSWAPPSEGDAIVESGAVIRSPADTPSEPESEEQTRWPWETATDPSAKTPTGAPASRTDTGPTIRTEDLYRSSADTKSGSDLAATAATPLVSGAGSAGQEAEAQPPAATIPPMTATYAVDPTAANPSQVTAPTQAERGLGTWGVFLLVTGITTVVGLFDMTMNREFTWFTGAAFVVASILGALMVRPRDLWTAVITPPIAFLVALVIAGQPTTITGSGSLLIREASLIGTGLAFNAPFIFGGTVAALIIVLIRRAIIGKR
ncbi:MAG: DUF6542 domain-containing protein [Candidatus Nanopelagicales bacterium]